MHPSHTHSASQKLNGSAEKHTYTYSATTITYTGTACVLLWLPWVCVEFVIDGSSDWCWETGGALQRASSELICTASYRITAHTGPLNVWEDVTITLRRVDNDADKLCLHSTYQVFKFSPCNCLTAGMFSNSGLGTSWEVCLSVSERFFGAL